MFDPDKITNELVRLGFEKWDDVEVEYVLSDADKAEILKFGFLTFFRIDITDPGLTFVIDHDGTLWAADGLFDLSYLGFIEVVIDTDGIIQDPLCQ